MPRTVEIKPSHTPSQLRRLAASTKDANQSRRLLSIAAVLDGMSADSELKPAGIPINYRPPFRFEAGHDSNQLSAVFRL